VFEYVFLGFERVVGPEWEEGMVIGILGLWDYSGMSREMLARCRWDNTAA
jgi:hypothetical protein